MMSSEDVKDIYRLNKTYPIINVGVVTDGGLTTAPVFWSSCKLMFWWLELSVVTCVQSSASCLCELTEDGCPSVSCQVVQPLRWFTASEAAAS